jgi:uncharacterized protein YacL
MIIDYLILTVFLLLVDINMINDIVVSIIKALLNRFAYDFTWEQRDSIQEILSENQPI